ncbi:MAG: M15 family metallopeptidase [Ferrimicrobium sp.]
MENHFHSYASDIILMDDPAVTTIPVQECGQSLVDLAGIPSLMIDERLADVEGHFRLVRSGIAERLFRAAESLPDNLRLLVVEGYRPPALQIQYFNQYAADLRAKYPGTSEREIHSLASRYVAPPFDLPPHCTGAAIDLTLAIQNGPELDMGTKVNESPEESGDRCYANSQEIPKKCLSNRTLLISALTGAGLVNYPTEWWHWSYGDRYWALKTAAPAAIYGLIDSMQREH